MDGIGAIIGVVVLLGFMAMFGWTDGSPPPPAPPPAPVDVPCMKAWNQAVPAPPLPPSPSYAPGAPRDAWVYSENGVCVVMIAGSRRWELRGGTWVAVNARAEGEPNAVADADALTLIPTP